MHIVPLYRRLFQLALLFRVMNTGVSRVIITANASASHEINDHFFSFRGTYIASRISYTHRVYCSFPSILSRVA